MLLSLCLSPRLTTPRSATPPYPPAPTADVRLGPYCGCLLTAVTELCLRNAALELATPVVGGDGRRAAG